MLIEKYAGALPLWIAPEQVRVMTVTEKSNEYAKEQTEKLKRLGIRATVDERQEKIGYKTVSYTHLDVYKRQGHGRSGGAERHRCADGKRMQIHPE